MNTSKYFLAVVLAVFLSACGGQGNGGSNDSSGAPTLPYLLGGTLTGLRGSSGVVLQNNGGDDLTLSANGMFVFRTTVTPNSVYSVTVKSHPSYPAQNCTVTHGAGTTASADISNVRVDCSDLPLPVLQVDANVHNLTLRWTSASGVSSFTMYRSLTRNCDINNASCQDGPRIPGVSSPATVTNLRNGQAYFFKIESVYSNGAHGVSNEAGGRPNALSFNGPVLAIAPTAGAIVYVGGNFNKVGITTGSAVPLDINSGRLATPDFPIVAGVVYATASDGAGGWYLGGRFSQIAAVSCNNLAHIRADGTVDAGFNPKLNGVVKTLAVSRNTIYAGGFFNVTEGATGPTRNLAAIAANGALLEWAPNPSGTVSALAVSGNTVFVGGSFQIIGGVNRKHLAAMDVSGALLDWDPSPSNDVSAIAILGNTVYVGGEFTVIGGTQRNFLAAFTTDVGSAAISSTPLPWNPHPSDAVTVLAVSGTTLYAGGFFKTIGGPNGPKRNNLAAIKTDDGALLAWDPNLGGFNPIVNALAVSSNTVYVGGTFDTIGGAIHPNRNNLAAIDVSGTLLDWTPNPSGRVNALAVSASTIYVGGDFNAFDAKTRNRLAAIDASGALLPWNPNANNLVTALAVSGNTIYAGGYFDTIGDASNPNRNYLAAIDTNGSLLPWNPNPDDRVLSLATSGARLYVGGNFTAIGGSTSRAPCAHLAWFDIGSGDLSPLQCPNPDNAVSVLAISDHADTVYLGGLFSTIGPTHTARKRLAAINANNGELLAWDPNLSGGGAFTDVAALAVSSNTIYVGGVFDTIGSATGATRNNLAAFNANGALLDWAPNPNVAVSALAVSGNTVYVGGDFDTIGGTIGQNRNHLAAIDTNGMLLPWAPNANGGVSALAVAGNIVYVGGSFTGLGETARGSLSAVDATSVGNLIP